LSLTFNSKNIIGASPLQILLDFYFGSDPLRLIEPYCTVCSDTLWAGLLTLND
jgi:hypothetical protein